MMNLLFPKQFWQKIIVVSFLMFQVPAFACEMEHDGLAEPQRLFLETFYEKHQDRFNFVKSLCAKNQQQVIDAIIVQEAYLGRFDGKLIDLTGMSLEDINFYVNKLRTEDQASGVSHAGVLRKPGIDKRIARTLNMPRKIIESGSDRNLRVFLSEEYLRVRISKAAETFNEKDSKKRKQEAEEAFFQHNMGKLSAGPRTRGALNKLKKQEAPLKELTESFKEWIEEQGKAKISSEDAAAFFKSNMKSKLIRISGTYVDSTGAPSNRKFYIHKAYVEEHLVKNPGDLIKLQNGLNLTDTEWHHVTQSERKKLAFIVLLPEDLHQGMHFLHKNSQVAHMRQDFSAERQFINQELYKMMCTQIAVPARSANLQ